MTFVSVAHNAVLGHQRELSSPEVLAQLWDRDDMTIWAVDDVGPRVAAKVRELVAAFATEVKLANAP